MADRKELEIDGKPLSSLRVVDLKMELEKRGMSKSGSKKELSDRLKMQLQLEKLHESASTDEGHVPNLRLQDDEIAEHNDIIKDYLAKQQQIYEMQKEAIRRVELERVRDSEASAGDTSQEEEELEPNQSTADKPCGLDLTVTSQNKGSPEESAPSEEIEKASPGQEEKDTVVDTPELDDSKTETNPSEVQAIDMTLPESEEKHDTEPTDGRNVTSEEMCPSSEVSEEPSQDRATIDNPEMDSDEIAAAVSEIENTVPAADYMEIQEQQDTNTFAASVSVAETAQAVEEISVPVHDAPVQEMEQIQMEEVKEEEAAEEDSSVLELNVAADDPVSELKNAESLESEEVVDTKNEEAATEVMQTEISVDQKDSVEQPTEMQVETESVQVQEDEPKAGEAEKVSQPVENPNRSPPRHRPKLKRRNDWGPSSSAPLLEKDQKCVTEKAKGSIDSTEQEKEDQSEPLSSKEEEEVVVARENPAEEDQRQEDIENITKEESHHVKSPSEKEHPKEMDSPEERHSEKTEEEDTRDGNNSQRSPSRDSSEYERPSRNRRRNRHSSTESSSSSKSSSGSRSRSRSSDSDTSRSESKSPTGSRSQSPKEQKNVPFAEESLETYEDSASRQSPRPTDEKMEPQEERMDVDELSPVEAVAATEDASGSNLANIAKAVETVQVQEGPVKISSRKISLSSSKEKKEKIGDGKENEGVAGGEGEKMQRKRRWGGSGAIAATDGKKLSLSISTDSLKGLIPDVKPLSVSNSGSSEPVLELPNDTREVSEVGNELLAKEEVTDPSAAPQQSTQSTKREAIIYRTVTQASNSSVVKDKSSEAVDKDPKKGKRLILRNSTSITLSEDKSTARRSPSPARYPPSCIVHIRNLVRPFTLNQLKELLAKTGILVEGGFWIDKIKSKCYVTYESEDQAVATRQALHGVQWPSSNPKRLIVDYASQDELEFHRSLTDAPEVKRMVQTGANTTMKEWPPARSPPPPLPHRKPSMAADVEPPARQHRDSRRLEREKDREKEKKEQRHNSSRLASGGTRNEKGASGKEREGERSKGREREVAVPGLRQPPIREWDRDKIGEKSPGERARAARNRNRLSVSRSRSRSRGGGAGGMSGIGDGRSPPLLNEGYGRRERDRDRNRGMDMRDRRDRKDRRKEEEEAPAKLLDDLFRKTKATPCIYWLPLTAEQINAKEEERRQRQVEREKRRQLEQAERDRNGNPNLEPNKRSRERQEDGRNRRRSASPIRARARRR